MRRYFSIRSGSWLFAAHWFQFQLRPTFDRYTPTWWSFYWLWFEVSRARFSDQQDPHHAR